MTTLSYEEKYHSRFWAKIIKTESCWIWTAAKNQYGYGYFSYPGGQRAHRFSYEIHRGKIPDELVIDHICRKKDCINPDHLRAVTHKENTLCGLGLAAKNAEKTHCKYGHEFSLENTYIRKSGNRTERTCRICAKHRDQRRQSQRKIQRRIKKLKRES